MVFHGGGPTYLARLSSAPAQRQTRYPAAISQRLRPAALSGVGGSGNSGATSRPTRPKAGVTESLGARDPSDWPDASDVCTLPEPTTSSSGVSQTGSGCRKSNIVHRLAIAECGYQGGDDLMQVADHGVVGVGQDRGARVGVDRDDVLGPGAAGDVLDRAADAAGQVQLRSDLGAGLADLLAVRPPALGGHHPGHADHAAEQVRELLQRGETVRPADAAAAADHDAR